MGRELSVASLDIPRGDRRVVHRAVQREVDVHVPGERVEGLPLAEELRA